LALNAIIFFYKALGTEFKNVQAPRSRRPAHIRHAPTPEETRQLLKTVQSDAAFATSLAVRLLYGCGLRVSEPLNLRIKDVNLEAAQLTIRAAKGAKTVLSPFGVRPWRTCASRPKRRERCGGATNRTGDWAKGIPGERAQPVQRASYMLF